MSDWDYKYIDDDGYVMMATKYLSSGEPIQYTHRYKYLYEMVNGKVPFGWCIHHINENKTDDRLENLIVLPDLFHRLLHRAERRARKHWHKIVIGRIKLT